MLRPTHFVILFAVVLCAYAAPASQPLPPKDAALSKGPLIGPSGPGTGGNPLEQKKPSGPEGTAEGPAGEGDLDTDATSHWGYAYYGPGYYGYAKPYGAWYGRGYGWNHGWGARYWY